jgi:16S rRNA (uracil1498-N3)-methyltransferase
MSLPKLHGPLRHPGLLEEGKPFVLGADELAGLALREINPKEAFTIVDRAGHFFRASLTGLESASGSALAYEKMQSSPESPAEITLLCAVLGRQRMLTVIQKATELGVVRVVPVLSEHSVPAEGLAHEKAHAWPKQALRAARQCRRASLPEVRTALPLAAALDDPSFAAAHVKLYLDDRANLALPEPAKERVVGTRVAFVVGPEGGLSDAERALLAARGARAVCLGGRVLRAETAVYAGLSLLQHAYGDM